MHLTSKHLVALAGLGSAALLGGAFVFQAFGYPPCQMCLWQRWPHALAMALGALGVLFPSRLVAVSGALAAFCTAAIGGFHTGVERGWWEGPTTCSSTSIGGLTADDLLDQIMAAPLIRCDAVAWELFGVSMASWNAAISLGLAVVWLSAWRKMQRA